MKRVPRLRTVESLELLHSLQLFPAFSSPTAAASANVFEGDATGQGGVITFKITRGGGLDGTVVLNYNLEGSATLTGDRFVGGVIPKGSVTFGPDVTEQIITIQLVNNSARNAAELLTLTVKDAYGNSQFTDLSGNLIASGSSRVTLLDDDPSTPLITVPTTIAAGAGQADHDRRVRSLAPGHELQACCLRRDR